MKKFKKVLYVIISVVIFAGAIAVALVLRKKHIP